MTIYPTWRRPTRWVYGSDPYWDNVSLLVQFDGNNGSTVFTDRSKNNNALTTVGAASISSTQSKAAGTSGQFLVNGAYITTPKTDQLNFLSANFTIEAWIYPLSPASNPLGAERMIFGMWSATDAGGQAFIFCLDAGTLKFVADLVSNDNTIFSISNVITAERWYHVAVTRNGSSMYCFVDGDLKSTYSVGTSAITTGNNTFGIGGYNRGTSNTASFYGYIDSLRVTKNVARYVSNFTVPDAEYPVGLITDPYFSSVSLLLHMNGANGSTTFTDSSSLNKAVTVFGDAQINTAENKFGGAAGYFDGSGDYLTIPGSTDFDIRSTPFTIELWVYRTVSAYQSLIGYNNVSTDYWDIGIGQDLANSNKVVFRYNGNDNKLVCATTLSINTWYHIAVTRDSSTIRVFLNGVLDGSVAASVRQTVPNSGVLAIGRNLSIQGSTANYAGYIDDLRFTKGVARYTSGFNLPIAAFPDY